jgi:excisionase family DNA binding protein
MAQGGSGGAGGVAAEMAVGMAMAQQMMNQSGGITAQATPGIVAQSAGSSSQAPASPPPDLLNPAQVAEMLGVTEPDVLATLEAGDLKGKKIGTQWRVTRAAVDAFLRS